MSRSLRFGFGHFTTSVAFIQRPEALAADLEPVLTVADSNTGRLVPGAADGAVVPAGEASKCWEQVELIIRRAIESGLGRDGMLAGIGGGMVCDLTAFTASLYMRGCRLALVPTTVVAMVDAALGGKTAINIMGYKNMAGTFYPAGEVRVCVALLDTLPEREFRAGLAEVIKTALLGDEGLYSLLASSREAVLRREHAVMEEVVRRSLAVKGAIVEEDFRESGRRAVLNLGHTFGHALEKVTAFRLVNHGEAVAWGMGRALELGVALGVTDPRHAEEVKGLLASYGFRLRLAGLDPAGLLAAMAADKKKASGRLRLVLQRGMCDTLVRPAPQELILEVLQAGAAG